MPQPHYCILTSDGRVGGGSILPLSAEKIAGAVPALNAEGVAGFVVWVSDTATSRHVGVRLVAEIMDGDFEAAVRALRAARPRQTVEIIA